MCMTSVTWSYWQKQRRPVLWLTSGGADLDGWEFSPQLGHLSEDRVFQTSSPRPFTVQTGRHLTVCTVQTHSSQQCKVMGFTAVTSFCSSIFQTSVQSLFEWSGETFMKRVVFKPTAGGCEGIVTCRTMSLSVYSCDLLHSRLHRVSWWLSARDAWSHGQAEPQG